MYPVTATQFACSRDLPAHADRAEVLVRQAAGQGARVVLIEEPFVAPHFCTSQSPWHFRLARPFEGNPLITRFADLVCCSRGTSLKMIELPLGHIWIGITQRYAT